MKNPTVVTIPEIGQVVFKHSKRARHLGIRIYSSKEIQVTVPYQYTFENAQKFFISKLDWVKKHLNRILKYEKQQSGTCPVTPVFDEESVLGLARRLDELAEKYNFSYNRVCIRNQKSRWGSCSAKNNINLNIGLTRIPEELRDYVILHELVHTRVKNHSRIFWVELDKILSGKKLNAELRKYRLQPLYGL